MNYLFYVGIILPTLITICLFLVFIYCWFLQKARKEVLTRRYDPHGKMRQLGLSMDPPPPPDFCRLEATATTPLAAHLSPAHYGEDNMAYCVSRSPSTDQQNQQQQQHSDGGQPARRSLYHTYHDSGISAGGLAALTESGTVGEDEGRPETRAVIPGGGMAYRTCPDSGVSGLSGGFCVPGEGVGCPQPACYLHQQLQYQEEQYHQQQRRASLQQQQQEQFRPQHLHHALVEASVHPTHGVCYGDNTIHPQSPQHYAPPPQYLQNQHQEQRCNPHHHNPILQHNDNRLGSLQQLQLAAQIHYPPSSSSQKERSSLHYPRRSGLGDDQVFELVSPSAQHPKEVHGQDFTTETSFGPQGALDIMVTSSSDPRIANISLPAQQSIVLSCLVQQQQQNRDQQIQISDSFPSPHQNHGLPQQHKQHNTASSTPKTKPKTSLPSSSSSSRLNHHRDSGINEDVAGASGGSNSSSSSSSTDQSGGIGSSSSNNSSNSNTINSSTSSSERPDSQASHSPSTTDSEDSGFRGSHCTNPALAPTPQAPPPASRLNKQINPLLKPMRRPRNKGSRKNSASHGSCSPPRTGKSHASNLNGPAQREPSTVANTDSSNPGSPTPLITLDPQNLSPPALMDSPSLGRGLEMIDMAGRGGPAYLRTPDSSPQHSPKDWSGDQQNSSRKNSKDGSVDSIVGLAPGDISTHLSWSYLHGLSSPQGGVPRPEGGASHLRQDMHHMEVLGYSVV